MSQKPLSKVLSIPLIGEVDDGTATKNPWLRMYEFKTTKMQHVEDQFQKGM